MAAGRFAEVQIILSGLVNTRNLRISLPEKRPKKLDKNRRDFKGRVHKMKEVEKLIGRLNRAAFIIPGGYHFLYGVREYFIKKGLRPDRKSMEEELELWKLLIVKAVSEVSINQLLTRIPELVLTTDSSKKGLGGFWSDG